MTRLIFKVGPLAICAALAVLLFSASGVDAQCKRVVVRKEIRDLTPNEFQRFVYAIYKLNSGPRPTPYDRFAMKHIRYKREVHSTPHFFPWHRIFTLEFERELQRIDPSVSVPYWDWSVDARSPEFSPVLQDALMGGNAGGGCVRDGAFRGFTHSFPNSDCLRRDFARGSSPGVFYPPTLLNLMKSRSVNYHEFRESFENGPHSAPHDGIGGDMAVMQSPNDPLFFLHHAFVDKQWDEWQRIRTGNLNAFTGDFDGRWVSPNDALIGYAMSVRDSLDINRLCYRYEPMRSRRFAFSGSRDGEKDLGEDLSTRPVAHFANADAQGNATHPQRLPASLELHDLTMSDRSLGLFKPSRSQIFRIARELEEELKEPSTMPDEFISMNNLNQTKVREHEAAVHDLIISINEAFRTVSKEIAAASEGSNATEVAKSTEMSSSVDTDVAGSNFTDVTIPIEVSNSTDFSPVEIPKDNFIEGAPSMSLFE